MSSLLLLDKLSAALPSYDTNGANITSTIWSDGTHKTHDQSLKNWLHEIKMHSPYNVNLLKTKTENFFARKQLLPIPLSPNCILIPFKVRRPIGENDGAYGYIALDSIETIEEAAITSGATIILKNSRNIIPVLTKYDKCKQHVAIANVVRNQYFDF
ncbi:hypothetical protein [Desulfuribacillus alkaliarsenatis]|uniref:Uncharacterized protein n=1 Tax=Desulfuribacillus alkaliarsenatis TaxID=766136 RepID=A0A1E5G083_9FIRM|nr:hypothetical protein [Desulfuribacillus alkaliarsenatis]OEF96109.1 hypothetical protein BHF68_10275 [Desulfuribacillus alkaliarsenatis]